jgi:predicted ATPase
MKSNPSKALRFSQLRLANWRNFDRAQVSLQGRVFLIGPNASGKSNLLDAFRFLHDLVALGGGFQEAISKRGGVSKLRCLAARRYPDVEIGVAVGGEEGPPDWEYDLSFSQDNRQRPFLRREVVKRSGSRYFAVLEQATNVIRQDLTRHTLSKSTSILSLEVSHNSSRQFAIFTSSPSWLEKPTAMSDAGKTRSGRISWSKSRGHLTVLVVRACAKLATR